MSESNKKLKVLIRQYILDIGGLLEEEPKEQKFDFGFKFLYPNKNGRHILVVKPKRKELIEVSLGTHLSPEHKKAFNLLNTKEKNKFIKNLQKIILNNGLEFNLRLSQEQQIFIIIDRIFFENNRLSINEFYKAVKKTFSCSILCIIYIHDFFSGEFVPKDFFTDDLSDPSLYM